MWRKVLSASLAAVLAFGGLTYSLPLHIPWLGDTFEVSAAPPAVEAGYTSNTTTGSTLTLTKPAGVQSGDLLLIFVGQYDAGPTPLWDDSSNKPSGFTFINHAGNNSSDCHTAAFYRVADGSEGSTVGVPSSQSNRYWGFYLRVTGAHVLSPIDAIGSDVVVTSATSVNVPAITTTVDDTLAFFVTCFEGTDGNPFSVSGSGWSKTAEIEAGSFGTGASGIWGTKDQASAGSTGTVNVDATGSVQDGWAGFQFAIAPYRDPPELGQASYRWFEDGDSVLNPLTTTVVDTSTDATGHRPNAQRKTFWDSVNDRYWVFYNNGSAIEYSNSADGSSWTSRGTTAVATGDFSIWHDADTTDVYLAYRDDNEAGIRMQAGTLSSTSISWGSPATVKPDNGWVNSKVSLTRASDGRFFLTYSEAQTNYDLMYLARSGSTDFTGAWQEAGGGHVGGDIGVLSVSPSGNLGSSFAVFVVTHRNCSCQAYLYSRGFSGSGWISAFQISHFNETGYDGYTPDNVALSMAHGIGDDAHVVFSDPFSEDILYYFYNGSSWEVSELAINDDPARDATISVDADGNPWVVWVDRASGDILAKRATAPYTGDFWSDSLVIQAGVTSAKVFSSAHGPSSSDHIPVTWFAGDSSPYDVSFYGIHAKLAAEVGSSLAAVDTPANAPEQGTIFRLRMGVHVSTEDMPGDYVSVRLQAAQRSGTCDTGFSGESYQDVATDSGVIRFANSPIPAHGAVPSPNGDDPVHTGHTLIPQRYAEMNPSAPNASSVPVGSDGMWDFALVDAGGSPQTSFCFRLVYEDGAPLESYSAIPEIITAESAGPQPNQLMRGGKWWNNGERMPFTF